MSSYGYCPECGMPGVERERRPDGNDRCSRGHVYPSRNATHPHPMTDKPDAGGKQTNLQRLRSVGDGLIGLGNAHGYDCLDAADEITLLRARASSSSSKRIEELEKALAAIPSDGQLTTLLRQIKQTLCVPAAEYVPAMGDAMLMLDRAIQLSYQTDPKWNPEPSPKVAAVMGASLLREATAAPLPPRELPKLRPVWRFPDGSTKELTGEEWANAKAAWGRPVAKAEGDRHETTEAKPSTTSTAPKDASRDDVLEEAAKVAGDHFDGTEHWFAGRQIADAIRALKEKPHG